MILTAQHQTVDPEKISPVVFDHHSVAVANIKHFVKNANPVLIMHDLDGLDVLVKAEAAAHKGILSSQVAANILGKAAPYFFRGFRPFGYQHRLLMANLIIASFRRPGIKDFEKNPQLYAKMMNAFNKLREATNMAELLAAQEQLRLVA